MKEKIKIEGIVHVFDFDAKEEAQVKARMQNGEHIREICQSVQHTKYEKHNMVLNTGIKEIARTFVNSGKLDAFKYIAIGARGGSVLPEDVLLYEEALRLPITSVYMDEQVGISVFAETFVGTQEANFMWLELGLVRGGTDSVNSGTLFSKIAITVDKNNQSAKTIMWEIRLKAGEE